MDLTSPKTIKEILQKHDLRPSKGFGQNFLIDRNVLDKIIREAGLNKNETVLEIGPGIGTLTSELAKNAKQVIAVEKDRNMCIVLKKTLEGADNITVLNEDILKFNFNSFPDYKVVANIPYYLTSPLIRLLLENSNKPKEIILMIQKEVAQRICEKPPKMSLLSVSVQFYADAKILFTVSKNSFLPAPKVDSAVIKITPLKQNKGVSADIFFKTVKAGFSHPRKQLLGNLSSAFDIGKEKTAGWLAKNNINPKQRAETLSVQDWINLSKNHE